MYNSNKKFMFNRINSIILKSKINLPVPETKKINKNFRKKMKNNKKRKYSFFEHDIRQNNSKGNTSRDIYEDTSKSKCLQMYVDREQNRTTITGMSSNSNVTTTVTTAAAATVTTTGNSSSNAAKVSTSDQAANHLSNFNDLIKQYSDKICEQTKIIHSSLTSYPNLHFALTKEATSNCHSIPHYTTLSCNCNYLQLIEEKLKLHSNLHHFHQSISQENHHHLWYPQMSSICDSLNTINNFKSVRETHQIAKAQQEKNMKLRDAFGISQYFVEGSSFDSDRKAKEDLAKSNDLQTKLRDDNVNTEIRTKYALVKSPVHNDDDIKESSSGNKKKKKKNKRHRSSSDDEVDDNSRKKKSKKRSSKKEIKKHHHHHHKRSSSGGGGGGGGDFNNAGDLSDSDLDKVGKKSKKSKKSKKKKKEKKYKHSNSRSSSVSSNNDSDDEQQQQQQQQQQTYHTDYLKKDKMPKSTYTERRSRSFQRRDTNVRTRDNSEKYSKEKFNHNEKERKHESYSNTPVKRRRSRTPPKEQESGKLSKRHKKSSSVEIERNQSPTVSSKKRRLSPTITTTTTTNNDLIKRKDKQQSHKRYPKTSTPPMSPTPSVIATQQFNNKYSLPTESSSTIKYQERISPEHKQHKGQNTSSNDSTRTNRRKRSNSRTNRTIDRSCTPPEANNVKQRNKDIYHSNVSDLHHTDKSSKRHEDIHSMEKHSSVVSGSRKKFEKSPERKNFNENPSTSLTTSNEHLSKNERKKNQDIISYTLKHSNIEYHERNKRRRSSHSRSLSYSPARRDPERYRDIVAETVCEIDKKKKVKQKKSETEDVADQQQSINKLHKTHSSSSNSSSTIRTQPKIYLQTSLNSESEDDTQMVKNENNNKFLLDNTTTTTNNQTTDELNLLKVLSAKAKEKLKTISETSNKTSNIPKIDIINNDTVETASSTLGITNLMNLPSVTPPSKGFDILSFDKSKIIDSDTGKSTKIKEWNELSVSTEQSSKINDSPGSIEVKRKTRSHSKSSYSSSDGNSSHSRSYSRASSRSSSRSSHSDSSSSSNRSRTSSSRSPSIPRHRGSPSFLDRRRITSARKRPIPYHRPTPSSPSSDGYSSRGSSHYSSSKLSRSRSPNH